MLQWPCKGFYYQSEGFKYQSVKIWFCYFKFGNITTQYTVQYFIFKYISHEEEQIINFIMNLFLVFFYNLPLESFKHFDKHIMKVWL